MITLSGTHSSRLTDFNMKVRVMYGLKDAVAGDSLKREQK